MTTELHDTDRPPADASTVQPVSMSDVRRRWQASVFGIVAHGRLRRRPSDIARVVVAVLIVAIAAAGASDISTVETAVVGLLASLPGGLVPVWNVVYLLAPIVAGILLVAALLSRHVRLLGTQVLAVALASIAAAVLSAQVTVDQVWPDASTAARGHTPDFPVVLLTAAAAGLWASRPYVTRPARRLLDVVIWLAALSAAFLPEGLPGSVIASLVLAWGAAAVAHLCLGSPDATPSADQVASSLRDLGVDPTGLRLAAEQTWGSTAYTAGPQSEISIDVVGRDSSDARLLAKVWRSIWYKESGPSPSRTRTAQMEHQAYVLFLAGRTGAKVPELVVAGLAGWRDDALVVVRNPSGTSLQETESGRLTDAVLDAAWTNLGRLHEARIAHGNPWTGNIVLNGEGTTGLVGLGDAVPSATDQRQRLDRVQLLTSSAELVGAERALAAARRGLSADDLVALLALLEPTALTSPVKRHLADRKALLRDLRDAGAALTGVEPPKPTELHRFSLSSVFLAAACAFGIYLLVAQLAGVAAMGDIFSDAIWGWVVATLIIAQLPQFAQGVAMLGAVSTPLPFGPVLGVQFANAFTGLVGGTAGNATLNIRFFQKQGVPSAVAVSSGILTSASAFIVQAFLIVVALLVTGSEFNLSIGSDGDGVPGWLVAVIVALLVAAVVLLFLPKARHRIRDFVHTQVRSAWDNLRGVLATPSKAVQLFGGNLAAQLLFAMTLGVALHAYGESLPLLQLVLINCVASFLGGAAPVPGGMGVIETGLIAGFTASGIPEAQAVAATFTARMCTSYLPPIWGWFALSWLRKKDYA